MKKNISILVKGALAFMTLFMSMHFAYASTVTESLVTAKEYLQSQPITDGSAMALSALGEVVDITYLNSFDSSSAISISKPIMAIVAAGGDPRAHIDTDLVSILNGFYDGVQIGDNTSLSDDFWGVLALVSAGEKDTVEILGAKEFILSNQNPDGGWSYAVGGASDTDDTAAAVMALIEAGVLATDPHILSALEYVKSNQNNDGGFLSNPAWGSDSNSSTDAWVVTMINKIGQDAANWQKNDKSPIDHLLSLQDADGGFWWVAEEVSDWNNKASTADVVIALLGESFPVVKMEYSNEVNASVRIEGEISQICDSEVLAKTALDVVPRASDTCGFMYTIDDTEWGPYLTEIAGEAALGNSGWMYFVNNVSPSVGSANYVLESGDSVLWYYGDWGWLPTRIRIDDTDQIFEVGSQVGGIVESYVTDDSSWQILPDAVVSLDGNSIHTDSDGSFNFTLDNFGVYEIVAEKDGFVRSTKETIVVGDTGQSVSMSVEIVANKDGTNNGNSGNEGGGDTIGFSVSPATLAFGQIVPGEKSIQEVTLSNLGDVSLVVKASIIGDGIFHFLKIAGSIWSSFEHVLGIGVNDTVDVGLEIPEVLTNYGNKAGNLVFWATAQ